ncbi:histidine kinase [Anaerococcus sp. AGMB00486]|uniref:Histidine kinase n=2 Tax=Anaerococcus TaxID=165779 RepID=A0ABX2NCY6_9FIRM|nr:MULTISPECIES: histidine kinase [Anaerococcus]MDY3005547.1 histidine kinase [Anaerococcus porci]MSS78607.1 histidine kinase [Anaerococcus porci]NVF12475.1 histidine kinase [Anaerococcus faecalis]
MGFLFNDNKEIEDKVFESFDDRENYLLTIKNDSNAKSFAKLLLSNIFNTFDSNRTFILYFSSKGIYEKEISSSIKGDFTLIPWHEVESFRIEKKDKQAFIYFNHIGKKMSYEAPFDGKLFKKNKDKFKILEDRNWNKI